MRKFFQRLDRFWFAAVPADRLAALRVLVGAFSLYYLAFHYFRFSMVASGDVDHYEPVGLATLLIEPLPVAVFQCIFLVTLLANAAFLLGWRYRYTGPLFGVLVVFLLCYRNSWSMIYHSDNLLVLQALILGFSRAADAFSLDSLEGVRLARPENGSPEAASSWRYGWPIRLICAITVSGYFLCGVAKVAGDLGWSWATGEALRGQLAVDALRKEFLGDGAPAVVFTLYQHIELFWVIGVGTLVLELGAPAALLHKWIGRWWAIGALMMHWGIYFIMGIIFDYSLSGIVFAAFFPLERPLRWASSWRAKAGRLPATAAEPEACTVVLFDGRCGMCRRSRRVARGLDWFGRVAWLDFHEPDVRAAVPHLRDEQLETEMWVITPDGRMRGGFEGWRTLLKGFPLTFLPSFLLYLPPVAWLGRRVYPFIARRRRLSCQWAVPFDRPGGPWHKTLQRSRPAGAAPVPEAISSTAAGVPQSAASTPVLGR
jgi:predicted DCC family thiol-disulfide oxidoreductase YuxK